MAYRKDSFAIKEFYHVYNRGNSKQVIYKDVADFNLMQQLLFLCNTSNSVSMKDAQERKSGVYSYDRKQLLVAIGAYTLLPNHFHILLTPLVEDGVSQFMRKVCTGYAMYFNKKYTRTGSLFEGKFRAKHAATDQYLKYLYAYIHLNPVKKPNKKTPRKDLGVAVVYSHSSLQDYIDSTRDEAMILLPEEFPKYFVSNVEVKNTLLEWLNNKPDNL